MRKNETNDIVKMLKSIGFEQVTLLKNLQDWHRVRAKLPTDDRTNKIVQVIQNLNKRKIAWEMAISFTTELVFVYTTSSAQSKSSRTCKKTLLETLPAILCAGVKKVYITSQDETIEIILE